MTIRTSTAARLLAAVWARFRQIQAGLPPGTAFPGVPDDRFQRLLSIRLFAAQRAERLRVIDLAPLPGGFAELLSSGAHSISAVATDARCRRWLGRHEHSELEVHDAVPDAEGAFDLVLTDDPTSSSLDAACRLLDRRGSLLLATSTTHDQNPSGFTDVEDALIERFVTIRRYRHVGPPRYRVQPNSRVPAAARAPEYGFIDHAPNEHDSDRTQVGTVWIAQNPRRHLPAGTPRLHVGCGSERLEGWINIDRLAFPETDAVIDVVDGLPFTEVEAIYAEHFLEHLPISDAIRFLQSAHLALVPKGVLRLSTPNLDWTWTTQYEPIGDPESDDSRTRTAFDRALSLNRAFYGWGHDFLWNRGTLELVLEATGFGDLRWPARGQSSMAALRNLERHFEDPDLPDRPHVLIVEATKTQPDPELLAKLIQQIQREFLVAVETPG